jgi:hypothetical protein
MPDLEKKIVAGINTGIVTGIIAQIYKKVNWL